MNFRGSHGCREKSDMCGWIGPFFLQKDFEGWRERKREITVGFSLLLFFFFNALNTLLCAV